MHDEPVFMMDINRSGKARHTPTNNSDVLQATATVNSILDLSSSVKTMMDSNFISLETYRENDSLDAVGVIPKLKLFPPVLPLLEYSSSGAGNPIEEVIEATIGSLLKEHKRGLGMQSKDFQSMFILLPSCINKRLKQECTGDIQIVNTVHTWSSCQVLVWHPLAYSSLLLHSPKVKSK
jgi:hypothetical protein